PLQRRPQEPLGRGPSQTLALIDVEIARALVVAAVEVVDARDAGLLRGLGPSVENLPAHPRLLDAPLTASGMDAVESIGLHRPLVLVLEKERKPVVPRPTRIAELAPVVVVAGLAAHVDHAVDGGAAAQDLPARILQLAPVQPRLARRLEAPVDPRIPEAVEIPDGDVDPHIVVLAARLEKKNTNVRIRRQPVGQHATGRP